MISGDRVYVINCHTSKISQIRGNKRYLAKFKNSAMVSTQFTIETKFLSGLMQLIIIESVYLAVKDYFQNMFSSFRLRTSIYFAILYHIASRAANNSKQ